MRFVFCFLFVIGCENCFSVPDSMISAPDGTIIACASTIIAPDSTIIACASAFSAPDSAFSAPPCTNIGGWVFFTTNVN